MHQDFIGASELIINERGCIYHLDLHPEELAPTVITVGDPDRVNRVSKYFDEIEVRKQHREFVTHTGRVGNKRISVVSTGIGPDNIDIVLNELDALVNIDFETRRVKDSFGSLNILRLGTSGALQEDIQVDDLVVSTFGLGLDNLMHFYEFENNGEEKTMLANFELELGLESSALNPYLFQGSVGLLQHFIDGFHKGITVTCPGFYAPQGRVLRQPLAFPTLVDRLAHFKFGEHRITNFEMETSAIYGLGRTMGHQCTSINTIIANRQTKEFSKDSAAAVENMIQKSLEIIAAI